MRHTKLKNKDKKISFMSKVTITPIIKLPWGEEDGIPEIFTGAPLTSVMVEKVPEQVRGFVDIRVMPFDRIILLTRDKTLLILTTQGKLINKLKITSPSLSYGRWYIIDFVMDENENIYLLESDKDDKNITYNVLRKIKKDGTVSWQKKEKVDRKNYNYQSINTTYQDFIVNNNHLYLCASHDDAFSIVELDKESGKLKPFHTFNESYERVFMDKNGYVYYVKERENGIRKRYWVQYDPKKNKENFYSGNEEMYELLGIPVATDDYGRGYGVFGLEMGCISKDNSIVWREKLENIVIAPPNHYIFISNLNYDDNSATVLINILKNDGTFDKKITLNIPDTLSQKYDIKNWKLIYVDEEDNFYVLGFNHTYQKILLTYNSEGNKIITINYEPGHLYKKEFTLQGANSWGIDGKGNVYLPVLGPDKFYVFKIEFIT
jgi:hypothetical protein